LRNCRFVLPSLLGADHQAQTAAFAVCGFFLFAQRKTADLQTTQVGAIRLSAE
jgi:hypothetical protein